MPTYVYKARLPSGDVAEGKLQASSEESAARMLQSSGLVPVSFTLEDKVSILHKTIIGAPAKTKDLILFARQMASMIKAGVPILESLQAMERQVLKKGFRDIIKEMSYEVEGGQALSTAMSRHPTVFNPFMLGITRTGEASGRLSYSLNAVAGFLEQDYTFMRKVKSALVYPAFVLAVVIIVSLVMFTFILPQLIDLFANVNVPLPWTTRVIIATTTFLKKFWYVIIIMLLVMGVLMRSYIRTSEGRFTVSTLILRIPGLNMFFQKIFLARLTSILHTLFSSDVPALESLELAKDVVGNQVYRRILDDTVRSIKDGASISSVWQHEPFIPPMLTSMVSVGERGGQVGAAFKEASRYFKQDVETMFANVAVIIEPLMIIILGIGVGIVVVSVILPIYNLVLVI